MSIKKEIFLVYPNSGSEENILYNKYVLPKRISLLTSLRAEKNGGGGLKSPPPQPLYNVVTGKNITKCLKKKLF